MRIKYHVQLTDDERAMLEAMIKQEKPKVAQHKKRRAGILLAIDENQSPLTHEQVAKAFRVRPVTICRLHQRQFHNDFNKLLHLPSSPILFAAGTLYEYL